jgi:chromosome partitioning protein
MVIIIGSNKGGAGKTTTAITIAIGLAKKGKEVCIIDADNQKSISRWASDREDSDKNNLVNITCLQKTGNIEKTIKALKSKYDYIIIDVAGRNSRELITGMLCADILISPVQCSQLDLDTLEELEEQVERVSDLNPSLSTYVLNVMLSTNHKVNINNKKEFEEYIKDFESFKVLKSINCYRKIYRDVISEGISIFEQNKDKKAIEESQELIEEIIGICGSK